MTSPSSARIHARQLSLMLVTDSLACGERSLPEVVAAAVAGGVTCVQLREKLASGYVFLDRARALRQLLKPLGIPLIINDRIDIALAAQADGVHLGQTDMPVADARRILPPTMLLGWSVETPAQVEAANDLDVDYLGVSPVFATPTKTDTAPPWGLEGLSRARRLTVKPLVAIGGISTDNIGALRSAGADGCAVVRAICSASDPQIAATKLRRAFDQGVI